MNQSSIYNYQNNEQDLSLRLQNALKKEYDLKNQLERAQVEWKDSYFNINKKEEAFTIPLETSLNSLENIEKKILLEIELEKLKVEKEKIISEQLDKQIKLYELKKIMKDEFLSINENLKKDNIITELIDL